MGTTTGRVDTPYGWLELRELSDGAVRLSSAAGEADGAGLAVGGGRHRVDVTWRRSGDGEWQPLLDGEGVDFELPQAKTKRAKVLTAMREVLHAMPAGGKHPAPAEQAADQAVAVPVPRWPVGRWLRGGPASLNVSAALVGSALNFGWEPEADQTLPRREREHLVQHVVAVSHAALPDPQAAQQVHDLAAAALAYLDGLAAGHGLRLQRTGDGVHVLAVQPAGQA